MRPLRRSLIVKEHATLPYPEGTACASVLIAGERGGDLARTAFQGLKTAFGYAMLQRIFHFIVETPTLALKQSNRFLPSAVLSGLLFTSTTGALSTLMPIAASSRPVIAAFW